MHATMQRAQSYILSPVLQAQVLGLAPSANPSFLPAYLQPVSLPGSSLLVSTASSGSLMGCTSSRSVAAEGSSPIEGQDSPYLQTGADAYEGSQQQQQQGAAHRDSAAKGAKFKQHMREAAMVRVQRCCLLSMQLSFLQQTCRPLAKCWCAAACNATRHCRQTSSPAALQAYSKTDGEGTQQQQQEGLGHKLRTTQSLNGAQLAALGRQRKAAAKPPSFAQELKAAAPNNSVSHQAAPAKL